MRNANMSTYQQKRQYSRADVRWPVFLLTAKYIVKGETKNISPGGAFINSLTDPVQEKSFRLVIKPPTYAGLLVVTAQVAWKSRPKRPDHMLPKGLGVQFTQISSSDRDYLNSVFTCCI